MSDRRLSLPFSIIAYRWLHTGVRVRINCRCQLSASSRNGNGTGGVLAVPYSAPFLSRRPPPASRFVSHPITAYCLLLASGDAACNAARSQPPSSQLLTVVFAAAI
jgi:hypothetical protein